MKRRSPNLTPAGIETIVTLIRGWEGRLTWPLLIARVAEKCRATYTRQALFKHHQIRVAYEVYRSAHEHDSRERQDRRGSATMKATMDRLCRLERENAELRKREHALFEQFHRWAYHASTRGLTKEFLDRPLPPLSRRGNPSRSRNAVI